MEMMSVPGRAAHVVALWMALTSMTGLLFCQTARDRSPLWMRLETNVSSRHSVAGSPIQAVVLDGHRTPDGFLIPVGSQAIGSVASVSTRRPNSIRLTFDRLIVDGRSLPFKGRVIDIDNARETVRADGAITGLDTLRKRPGKIELLLLAAAHAHPAIAIGFETAKLALREIEPPRCNSQ